MSSSDGKTPQTSNWQDNSGYSNIELYPDDTYKSFVPNVETEWVILGFPVKLKAQFIVSFYPGGTFKLCSPADDTSLVAFDTPVVVAAGCVLGFHENGNIRTLTLAAPGSWLPWRVRKWKYRGKIYEPGTTLEFSEDGTVVKADRA